MNKKFFKSIACVCIILINLMNSLNVLAFDISGKFDNTSQDNNLNTDSMEKPNYESLISELEDLIPNSNDYEIIPMEEAIPSPIPVPTPIIENKEEELIIEQQQEEFNIEEPIVEEPIIEEITSETSEEQPIEEQIIEEPIVEEPIIEEPTIEEPIVEEPIIEEPVLEIPEVDEEPIIIEDTVQKIDLHTEVVIDIPQTIISVDFPIFIQGYLDLESGNLIISDLTVSNNSTGPIDITLEGFILNGPFNNYITPSQLPNDLDWNTLTVSQSLEYFSIGIMPDFTSNWREIYKLEPIYYLGNQVNPEVIGSLNPNTVSKFLLISNFGRSYEEATSFTIQICFSASLTK